MGDSMILSHQSIKRLIDQDKLVIDPLFDDAIRENGIDLRLAPKYAIPYQYGNAFGRCENECSEVEEMNNLCCPVDLSDPYNKEELAIGWEEFEGDIVIPPNSAILTHTVEYVELPPNVAGLCNLRSTLARFGLYVPPTVVDAGFRGQLVIEMVNNNYFPVKIPHHTRFLHLVLLWLDEETDYPYKSSYQGQRGIKYPKPLKREVIE